MYKIAVLDDDEQWGFVVQRYLRKHFDVSVYTDVQTFLRSKTPIDLIIVDFTLLPASELGILMNGCELIRHLKQILPNPPIAILASGYINPSDLEDTKFKGSLCSDADMFVAKDAGLEVILSKIQRLLESKELQQKPELL